MRIIHVLRKPLSEGTVAANTLKHGTGGLNIDASRIGTAGGTTRSGQAEYPKLPDGREDRSGSWARTGHSIVDVGKGRWPANVILQHLDGCRCDGTKRVKGCAGRNSEGRSHSKYRFQGEGTTRTDNHLGYADKDGKETVANWLCEPGCPVARLDEQSGDRSSPWAGNPNRGEKGGQMFGGQKDNRPDLPKPEYRDAGGASRFYKQVGGSE